MHRYVYSTPGDAQLSAVDVKGGVFLAWAQMALAAPPFFMQVSRVDIGRDQNREPQCQINTMQVRANRKQPRPRDTNDDRREGGKEWIECECRSHSAMHGLWVQVEDRPFSPSGSFRIITTATLLTSAASLDILGNETSATTLLSPHDGIVDAAAVAINAKLPTHAELPRSEIRDSTGEPLNSACATVCDAGSGVQAEWRATVQGDDLAASTGNQPKCAPCPAGAYSMGGNTAKCQLCEPGSCEKSSAYTCASNEFVCRPLPARVGAVRLHHAVYVICCTPGVRCMLR